MNHWTLVALDIWKVVKYLLPFIGSFMITTVIFSLLDNKREYYFAQFIVYVIGAALYWFGMSL